MMKNWEGSCFCSAVWMKTLHNFRLHLCYFGEVFFHHTKKQVRIHFDLNIFYNFHAQITGSLWLLIMLQLCKSKWLYIVYSTLILIYVTIKMQWKYLRRYDSSSGGIWAGSFGKPLVQLGTQLLTWKVKKRQTLKYIKMSVQNQHNTNIVSK